LQTAGHDMAQPPHRQGRKSGSYGCIEANQHACRGKKGRNLRSTEITLKNTLKSNIIGLVMGYKLSGGKLLAGV